VLTIDENAVTVALNKHQAADFQANKHMKIGFELISADESARH